MTALSFGYWRSSWICPAMTSTGGLSLNAPDSSSTRTVALHAPRRRVHMRRKMHDIKSARGACCQLHGEEHLLAHCVYSGRQHLEQWLCDSPGRKMRIVEKPDLDRTTADRVEVAL